MYEQIAGYYDLLHAELVEDMGADGHDLDVAERVGKHNYTFKKINSAAPTLAVAAGAPRIPGCRSG